MMTQLPRQAEKDVLGAMHLKQVTYQNIFASVKSIYALA